jgi:GR25 family glycosyltransferase involved in LPS biosynthesis
MDITSIRYINMDKNWHRKLFMELLLGAMSYPVIRKAGVKFRSDNPSYDKYLTLGIAPYVNSERSEGVVGCWIAHSQVLEEITEQAGITVVLEDDFVCRPKFFENALRMVNAFDRDFDVILFDPWGTGPLAKHKIAENIYFPANCTYPYYGGSHCLFINNTRIPRILEAKLTSEVMDYDGFLLGSGKIDTYIFYTKECATQPFGSDITPSFNKVRKAIELAPEQLKMLEGKYCFQLNQDLLFQIIAKKDHLLVEQFRDEKDLHFLPESELKFFARDNPLLPIRFIKNQDGAIVQLVMNEICTFDKLSE